jgi:hypothetical protein
MYTPVNLTFGENMGDFLENECRDIFFGESINHNFGPWGKVCF